MHAVSGFLLERGGNIEEAAQYNDHDTGLFFMRVHFACDQLTQRATCKPQLNAVRRAFGMAWKLHAASQPMKTRDPGQQGRPLPERPAVPLEERPAAAWTSRAIVSNHRDFYQLAASYNVPFHHIPVTAATKAQAEAKQCEIIEAEGAELVVLARYMQILSNDLCRKLAGPRDQHPPQLPAQLQGRQALLPGARPRREADRRHRPLRDGRPRRRARSSSRTWRASTTRDTVEDLTARGRDTESQVLARAVKWHSEHRVLLNGHRTVIFK